MRRLWPFIIVGCTHSVRPHAASFDGAGQHPLGAGEVHRYGIVLARGQVVRGAVEQRGVDVMVTTFAPNGRKLDEIDSPNGEHGDEPFLIDATSGGEYIVEVKLSSGALPHGGYATRIDQRTTHAIYTERRMRAHIRSPRLFRLWQDLGAHREGALPAFWVDVAKQIPLIEPVPDDPNDVLVTFVYRLADPRLHVSLWGGPTAREKPLEQLADTDVWYLTARMPADARFSYDFIVKPEPNDFQDDYLPGNERVARRSSLGTVQVELARAPVQPWSARSDSAKGTLVRTSVDSASLHEKRDLAVYTPPGYDRSRTYPLLVVFDGEWYGMDPRGEFSVPQLLDNLIAAGAIPPVVAVLVANQGTRDRDLPAYDPFVTFVVEELIPRVRADYNAGVKPSETIAAGSSLGGLTAFYAAVRHPDVIGNVLAQSTALPFGPQSLNKATTYATDRNWLAPMFAVSPHLPIRIYMDVGVFETDSVYFDLLRENRRLRDVLVAKGYDVTYAELHGGHDNSVWRGAFPDGLRALTK